MIVFRRTPSWGQRHSPLRVGDRRGPHCSKRCVYCVRHEKRFRWRQRGDALQSVAKCAGSYAALIGGSISEGLRLLTSAVPLDLALSTNELWHDQADRIHEGGSGIRLRQRVSDRAMPFKVDDYEQLGCGVTAGSPRRPLGAYDGG